MQIYLDWWISPVTVRNGSALRYMLLNSKYCIPIAGWIWNNCSYSITLVWYLDRQNYFTSPGRCYTRSFMKRSWNNVNKMREDMPCSDPSWWRHQMETFSALLAICAGNSPVGEFSAQRSVTRSFDVFFDLRLNKRLSKQPCGWWFETPSRSLWSHCNVAGAYAILAPPHLCHYNAFQCRVPVHVIHG